ncbi:response regulator [Syntrophothermus lipocalidus]|uniref:Stage 0 sporulation protein A homolog n=1 Tax=Syntrophothermus lipocalidus (strain DSM 12680 / TGB-C1) TaxID=643648 RepID=D7CPQ2_SYNLT|nr:response regulator transcription factor [Syntrophothermus lipocalidus]ADI02680.1 two component transcriptional regulator, LuxR family [Syntrophothermus lipocalidus DSM 12680]
MDKVRVLIADDHALVREGLRRLLELDERIEVVGEAGDGQGAINLARKYRPDVILMDVNMPGTDGVAATQVIKKEMPETDIIALTVYEDEQVVEMVKAGVSAYVLKDVGPDELTSTIFKVREGNVIIHPRVAGQVAKELVRQNRRRDEMKLTKRERDVLELLVKGYSNKEVAAALFISEKTVKNHLTSIFRKLEVKDRTQAVIYALKNKVVKTE